MKLSFLTLLLCSVLFIVFCQDVKKRTIHISLPLSLFILALAINYFSEDLKFGAVLYNIIFVFINILGLIMYFSFKTKALVNPIDSFIGLGDIVFFLALTPLFNLRPFILFFVFGLLFSLLAHWFFSFFKDTTTIPLAGYLSVFLILNIVVKNVVKIDILF